MSEGDKDFHGSFDTTTRPQALLVLLELACWTGSYKVQVGSKRTDCPEGVSTVSWWWYGGVKEGAPAGEPTLLRTE